MKKILYFTGGFLFLLIGYIFVNSINRRTICNLHDNRVRIDTIKRELFFENTPQIGTLERDTALNTHVVHVQVDELFLNRISIGTKAISIDDRESLLTVTQLYPTITNGRFNIDMKFDSDIPDSTVEDSRLRIRIKLGEASNEILLPDGGFYFYSRGKWIFVVEGNRVVRRNIKLGRHMVGNGFEVLSGLSPGDRVVTSSYEKFKDKQSLDLSELETIVAD